jgi:CDP-diacylglycerol--glycerol-3-phosphate 3-phosphatidyltransferase
MGWPNRITLARAFLTLAVWVLVVYGGAAGSPGAWCWAFWLFVVAAASDALDGILARRLAQESVFGRIADPLVDKLLVLGTGALVLGAPGGERFLPGWALALLVAREMLVTALRAAAEARDHDFRAIGWGKTKMVLQCAAIAACLLALGGVTWAAEPIETLRDLPGSGRLTFAFLLVAVATLVTVASAIPYVARARAVLRG